MADGDQSLAAEPGFHGDPPQSGGSGLTTVRRLSGHYSEAAEQQLENGLALASGPAQALGGVVKDGAADVYVEPPKACPSAGRSCVPAAPPT